MTQAAYTVVTYNGVTMENCLTRGWTQECVYDASGTDLIANRFTLEIEAIVHDQSNPNVESGLQRVRYDGMKDGEHLQGWVQEIQSRLGTPRAELLVKTGGETLLHCVPTTQTNLNNLDRDVSNGPHPSGVRVTSIVGDKIVRVLFSVKCDKVNTPKNASGAVLKGPWVVLNNRWSISESMDDNFFTTRTIRGRMRLSAHDELLPEAHSYKDVVVPSLEDGFKRERIDFSVSENGLDCDYSVTDRQVHTAAPWPATKISGTHTESTTGGGHIFISSMIVRLEGPPHADKRDLMRRAIQVCDSRLHFLTKKMGDRFYLEQAAIVDFIGETNAVEVRACIRQSPGKSAPPGQEQEFILGNIRAEICSPLTLPPLQTKGKEVAGSKYERTQSPNPALYGYTPHGGYSAGVRKPMALFMLHCYTQMPWEIEHSIGKVRVSADLVPDAARVGNAPAVSERPFLPVPHDVNKDKLGKEVDNIYTYATMESVYFTHHCRVQLPIARRYEGSAAPPADSFICSLARPQCRREITVSVEMIGGLPAIPKPVDTYNDGALQGTLLKHSLSAIAPSLTSDGKATVHRLRATYLYAMNRAPTAVEKLQIGVLPFVEINPDDAKFDPQVAYRMGSINPGG